MMYLFIKLEYILEILPYVDRVWFRLKEKKKNNKIAVGTNLCLELCFGFYTCSFLLLCKPLSSDNYFSCLLYSVWYQDLDPVHGNFL